MNLEHFKVHNAPLLANSREAALKLTGKVSRLSK